MPWQEYQSWIAFYREEPFGDTRADLRAGMVAAVVARTMGRNKHAKPIDFMPIVKAQREADDAAMSKAARVMQMRQTFEGNLGAVRVRRTKINKG